jgi:hypothetical protein
MARWYACKQEESKQAGVCMREAQRRMSLHKHIARVALPGTPLPPCPWRPLPTHPPGTAAHLPAWKSGLGGRLPLALQGEGIQRTPHQSACALCYEMPPGAVQAPHPPTARRRCTASQAAGSAGLQAGTRWAGGQVGRAWWF